MLKEMKNLDASKSGPFMDISVKRLKETADIVVGPLVDIWVEEIVQGRKFVGNLKLGDISPSHIKLENILRESPLVRIS